MENYNVKKKVDQWMKINMEQPQRCVWGGGGKKFQKNEQIRTKFNTKVELWENLTQ